MTTEAHKLAASRGFLQQEDVDLIIELTKKLYRRKELTVVDLGAGSGTTAGSVFAARTEGVNVFTYDLSPDAIYWAGKFIENLGLKDQWDGYLVDSAEAAEIYPDGSVDLLMVDSSHTYEHTVREIEVWRPKVAKGGWVWLHDYKGPDSEGVRKAVDEAVKRGELKVYKQAGYGWAGQVMK